MSALVGPNTLHPKVQQDRELAAQAGAQTDLKSLGTLPTDAGRNEEER